MKIALAQMQMDIDKRVNEKKSLAIAGQAAKAGADLLLYPELTLTPFFPQYPSRLLEGMGIKPDAFSIEKDAQILTQFSDAARENGIYLVYRAFAVGNYLDDALVGHIRADYA